MPVLRRILFGVVIALSSTAASRAGENLRVSDTLRPLPFHYDLYTFRGERGRTAVVTSYAVEAGNLETESFDGRSRYRFSVTLVLADTALRAVRNVHDTVVVALQRPLSKQHLLYTHIETLAPPSTSTEYRVIMTDVTTPGIGQMYRQPFIIPDYSGTELMLSDIALGDPGASIGWTRGGVTLALLPTSQFPESSFDVFYEIYNLPAGRPYTTDIMIERLRTRSDPEEHEPIRLRFEGESTASSDAVLAELRRVDAPLERGSYRITVTITDRTTGAAASRSRSFDVLGWDPGTTMVPAASQRSAPRTGER